MISRRFQVPTALALAMGVFLGWGLSSLRPVPLRASAGDRSGESIVATGAVHVQFDETVKASIALEAVYFLDYKGGRLLGTVPSFRQTAVSTQLINTFAERDLVADFKLDLDIGPRPHFLMTTGALGAYSAGWAPLYVFETTSSQLAVYRMQLPQTLGVESQAKFDLVEIRSYAKAAEPKP
jgi:hypothetical protein